MGSNGRIFEALRRRQRHRARRNLPPRPHFFTIFTKSSANSIIFGGNMLYCKGKIRTRFFRYLLSALPFIVFVILEYYCILFAATHLKILPQKVQSNQKRQDGRSGAAKPAARAEWHGQGFQQCMGVPVSAFDRVRILPLQYNQRESTTEKTIGGTGYGGSLQFH